LKLNDKVAIVTGGCSGIGMGTALLFSSEGATVAVIDLKPAIDWEPASRKIAENGRKSMYFQGDV